MITLAHFQIVSAALFAVGLYGVLARRSAVLILMSIELMLNAVNLNLIAVSSYVESSVFSGLIIAIFVITVAAAEVGLALAIVLRLFRNRASVNVDEIDLMKW
jgi:NADH:ubiquinone oxidoreductase subunit K